MFKIMNIEEINEKLGVEDKTKSETAHAKEETEAPKGQSASEKETEKETKKEIEYEGVEKENPHAIEYSLDEWEKDKFLELKDELSRTEDPDRATEIRKEMADILGKSYKDRAEKEQTKKADKEVKTEEKEEKKENKTMSPEERKARIDFIIGKLAEFQKRYADEVGKM